METWRQVVGFEGQYEVSSRGQVRGVDRIDSRGRKWRGRLIKPTRGPRGHLRIGLTKDGVTTKFAIPHLVLEAFVQIRPGELLGCHNDGDPSNNAPGNLRWDTYQGNADDRAIHGRWRTGFESWKATVTRNDAERIRDLRRSGMTYQNIKEWLGFSHGSIANVLTGKFRFT